MIKKSNITAAIKHMFSYGYAAYGENDELPLMKFSRKDKDYEFIVVFNPIDEGPLDIHIRASYGTKYSIFRKKSDNTKLTIEDPSIKDILEHTKILLEIKRLQESGLPERKD